MGVLELISPSGVECVFSIDQNERYLFFHSAEHSMQWGLNSIGVMIEQYPEHFKIKLISVSDAGCHGFIFEGKEQAKKSIDYFRLLKFPVPEIQIPII